MTKKKRTFNWPVRRWLLWLAGFIAILLTISVIILLRYPAPTAAQLEANRQQYLTIRAHFPNRPELLTSEKPPALSGPTQAELNSTTSSATVASANETDQERCDRLFRQIIHSADFQWDAHKLENTIPNILLFDTSVTQARQLASFDERSIRISDAARQEYQLFYGRLLGQFADELAQAAPVGMQPSGGKVKEGEYLTSNGRPLSLSTAETQAMIVALQFLRVARCPAMPSGGHHGCDEDNLVVNWQLRQLLDPGGERWDTLPPIPQAILTLDPDLLAPRDMTDWDRYVGQVLDMRQETIRSNRLITNPITYYNFETQMKKNRVPGWFKGGFFRHPVYRTGVFAYTVWGAVAGRPERVRAVQRSLDDANDLHQYAQAASASGPIGKVDEGVFLRLKNTNHQIVGRALAAALALRQGKPIPALDTLTPDSYFFDPITRQALRLYQAPVGATVTRLYLVWPIRLASEDRGILKSQIQQYYMSVLVPASHPGLAAIARLADVAK